jgi:putative tricarboxylic transport membrane protein
MKPLIVFSRERLPAFPEASTLVETGDPFSHAMPRIIAGPPGMSAEAQLYYVKLFKKVFDSPEWRAYREENSLTGKFITGPALTENWQDEIHKRRNTLTTISVFNAMNPASTGISKSQ